MTRLETGVPLVTIGGYLGAGKTTLLNALLSDGHGLRIGVLVNDFGSVSIDEKLIVAREGDVMTLANGCACCSVAGDLATALDRLVGQGNRYELLVIEASGVADPARIATLARSPGLRQGATIVVADVETIQVRARDKFVGRLVCRQLRSADIVVLNKADLVDAARMQTVRAFVALEAPHARLCEAVYGHVPLADLIRLSPRPSPALACLPAESDLASALFESHYWTTEAPPDMAALEAVIAALPPTVLRVKGVIGLADGHVVSLQRAGERVEVSPLHKAVAATGAEIVVIGRPGEIDWAYVDEALDASVLSSRKNP
jgi:G3E family GTPase